MAHTCHAIGCNARVPPQMFMCKRHWFMVPQCLRNRIWSTYRPGQCDDWQVSAEYCDAAKESLLAVAQKEGRTVDPSCPELQLYEIFRPAHEESTSPSTTSSSTETGT